MNYICNYALAKKESLTLAKLPGLTLPTFLPINMVSEFSLIYVIMEGEAANSRPTGEDAQASSTNGRGNNSM
jgi:hypothetical protein